LSPGPTFAVAVVSRDDASRRTTVTADAEESVTVPDTVAALPTPTRRGEIAVVTSGGDDFSKSKVFVFR